MGQLRDTWKRTKKWSEDVASGKITFDFSGGDAGGTKKAIKSFTEGFGGALDNVEKAFKAKKDADTKKLADKALTIATTYKGSIEKYKNKMGGSEYANFVTIIDILIRKLTDMKTNGAAAKIDF
jgi:hypothetical protein